MAAWLLKKLNSLGKLNLFMYNFSNSKQWQDNSFRGISPHHHMTWVWKCELTCVFLMWINSLTPVLYSLSYHLYVSPHELVSHPSSWLFLSLLHVFWHEFSLSWKSVIACHLITDIRMIYTSWEFWDELKNDQPLWLVLSPVPSQFPSLISSSYGSPLGLGRT